MSEESTENALKRTQNELEKLKADFQEFAYLVSHDLSGPLRQIEGFSTLILRKQAHNFDEKTRRHFDLIIEGSIAAKQQLDALLIFSRIGNASDAFSEVDINKVVGDVCNELSREIESAGASIEYPDLPTLTGDRKLLHQLFRLLLDNALLYRAENKPAEVTVTCEDLQQLWKFSIRDNGIGVSSKFHEKIFKIFKRAVTDTEYPGLGAGLAFAKKIVNTHGGEIWVESEEGNGSKFFFTLQKDL